MKIKDSFSRKLFIFVNTLIMIGLIIITLYPMLYVLFASFSSPSALMAHEGLLLYPLKFTTIAYSAVAENPFIFSGYAITIWVVVVSVAIQLVLTLFGAYFFTRKNVMHKKMLMLIIMFTVYVGGGLIPTYLMYKGMGLENSLWVLVLPGMVNTTHLIILRTAIYGVPDSLEEAATIDGAGHYTILFKIITPLVVPTLAVIAMYSIVGHWNAWFNASIFIRDRAKFPLQLILREILIQNDTSSMDNALTSGVDMGEKAMLNTTIQYATIMVATLPVLCIYPFLQKYFVKGTTIGAVKE